MTSRPEEIAIKATELLTEIYGSVQQMEKKISEFDNRIKNIEFTNRMIISELRKPATKESSLKNEETAVATKTEIVPLKQELNEQVKKIVTQKILWPNGQPVRLAKVVAVSQEDSSFKKTMATKHDGTWLFSNLPFGKYDLLISTKALEERSEVNFKSSFDFFQSPLDLGILEIK